MIICSGVHNHALAVVGGGQQEGGGLGEKRREGAPGEGGIEIFNSNKETVGTAQCALCREPLPDLYRRLNHRRKQRERFRPLDPNGFVIL